jgi:hypothetical protein
MLRRSRASTGSRSRHEARPRRALGHNHGLSVPPRRSRRASTLSAIPRRSPGLSVNAMRVASTGLYRSHHDGPPGLDGLSVIPRRIPGHRREGPVHTREGRVHTSREVCQVLTREGQIHTRAGRVHTTEGRVQTREGRIRKSTSRHTRKSSKWCRGADRTERTAVGKTGWPVGRTGRPSGHDDRPSTTSTPAQRRAQRRAHKHETACRTARGMASTPAQ